MHAVLQESHGCRLRRNRLSLSYTYRLTEVVTLLLRFLGCRHSKIPLIECRSVEGEEEKETEVLVCLSICMSTTSIRLSQGSRPKYQREKEKEVVNQFPRDGWKEKHQETINCPSLLPCERENPQGSSTNEKTATDFLLQCVHACMHSPLRNSRNSVIIFLSFEKENLRAKKGDLSLLPPYAK